MNIWKPHLTVAAVIEEDEKFLFVEEEVGGELVINQPAGHLDEGETLIHAAIRETKEETSYDFIPKNIVGIYKWSHPTKNKTFVRVCYCGEASNPDENQKLDQGIVRALWLSKDDLIKHKLRSPMVLNCINDYLDNKRYPIDIITEII